MAKTKLSKLEEKYGVIACDRKKYPTNSSYEENEFIELLASNIGDFTRINHSDRIKFLQDNGYEVTHENMIDSNLSSKEA